MCGTLAGIELGYIRTCQWNPGIALRPPDPKGMPEVTMPLEEILVQERTGTRRKRRFRKSRKEWKSFAHIPGGKSLINKLVGNGSKMRDDLVDYVPSCLRITRHHPTTARNLFHHDKAAYAAGHSLNCLLLPYYDCI